ncbi:alpha/beta hydrolase family protein [Ceratobasidium sp. AG-Ba]|nr:alpha/beta hydrolase family protein [Ceratobasidium sp. AG-Ba]
MLAPLAAHYGIRVISIDRPGCGGSPLCPLKSRLDTASDNARSVLEYLGVDPENTAIATHSAGAVHPDIFPRNPRVFMTSAWVPVSSSGQMGLNLVPSVLVSNFHNLMPPFLPLINASSASLAFSKGLLKGSSKSDPIFTPPHAIRPLSSAPTTFHSNHALKISANDNKAILDCVTKLEPMQGVSEDYMLCLGRGEGSIDAQWYSLMAAKISSRFLERGARVHFELWWGLKDGLIPVRGQRWFTELLVAQKPTFDVVAFELIGAGHDDLLSFAEVVCPIFEEIRALFGV